MRITFADFLGYMIGTTLIFIFFTWLNFISGDDFSWLWFFFYWDSMFIFMIFFSWLRQK